PERSFAKQNAVEGPLIISEKIRGPSTAPFRGFAQDDNNETRASLAVLCRTMEQVESALACGVATIYADFEDIRRYKDAVALVREHGENKAPDVKIFLATPRIQKAGEQGFF